LLALFTLAAHRFKLQNEKMGSTMPRLYDYSRNLDTSTPDYIWMRYNAPIRGKAECDLFEMFGPFGTRMAFAFKHQFELDVKDGRHPYQNEVVDPVFSWIDEKLKGPWNWREAGVNEGRSMSTRLYIKNNDDQRLFMETWGDMFSFSQSAESSNKLFEQKLVEATAANVMPPWAKGYVLKNVFLSLVADDYEKIASFSDRVDFVDTLTFGLTAALASLDEIEPTRFGPLFEDGTWGQGMLELFRDLSRWIDVHAPAAVKEAASKALMDHPKATQFLELGRSEATFATIPTADPSLKLS
jgi:hypothetical protein